MMDTSKKILNVLKKSSGLTLTQIKNKTKMNHKPVIFYHLNKLMNEGKIIKKNKIYLFLSDIKQEFIELPYYGKVRG